MYVPSMVVLYVVVPAALFGLCCLGAFILKARGQSELLERQRSYSMEWGPPGIGKVLPSIPWPRWGMPEIEWSYPSAYHPTKTVHFSDPAEALEYVVKALQSKNQTIDRLESSLFWSVDEPGWGMIKGMASHYEWLWADTHTEREYWLTELREFAQY